MLTSDTDRSVPNQALFAMAEVIPGAKLVVIPECGHLPSLEKPEALTAALLEWLTKHLPRNVIFIPVRLIDRQPRAERQATRHQQRNASCLNRFPSFSSPVFGLFAADLTRLRSPHCGRNWSGHASQYQSATTTMAGIAKRILDEAPREFAIAGHSMGGFICLEVMRQAPERVKRLALLSTSARPDAPESTERRLGWIAETKSGGYHTVLDKLFSNFVHPSRRQDANLQKVVREMGLPSAPKRSCTSSRQS